MSSSSSRTLPTTTSTLAEFTESIPKTLITFNHPEPSNQHSLLLQQTQHQQHQQQPYHHHHEQNQLHQQQQQQQPTPPDLPVHITLLYLTHLHLSTAFKLSRALMVRPNHSHQLFGKPPILNSTESLQSNLIQYRHHILIAINCLRSIVYSSDSLQIPTQFKFNALLWLIRVLPKETQSKDEIHHLVQLGCVWVKKNGMGLDHDSKFELTELELLVAIEDSNVSLRQIKKQVERAIDLTINKNGSIPSKSIRWYYRFQILYIQINSSKDYSSTQKTIQTVLQTSLNRGDQDIHLLLKAIEIKLALDHSLFTLVGELIDSIIKLVGFKTDSTPTLKLSKPLEVFYVVLICFYHYEMGNIEVGKEWVSYLHRIMDGLQLDNGSFKVFIDSSNLPDKSTVQIDSPFTRKFGQISMFDDDAQNNTQPNATKDFVSIKLMPIEVIQALVSLISASIHFDGYGKRPKALTYLNEGIQKIDELLMNGLKIPFPEMQNCIQRLTRMKIEGMLMMSQMSIIRSNFLLADQILLDLIRVTTLTQQWNQYASRICFFKAMLSQSTLNFKSAKESLLASLSFIGSHSIQMRKEIKVLTKASYVMLEIDQLEDSNRIQEWLEEFQSFDGSNRVEIALQIVFALKCGEIVRAKHHFTNALNESNRQSNTHLKTILLGLLGNLFLNTRTDQALKMLKASFKASNGFRDPATLAFNPNVGTPGLGLWSGTKLLEIYESGLAGEDGCEEKIRKQIELNRDHQIILESIPNL